MNYISCQTEIAMRTHLGIDPDNGDDVRDCGGVPTHMTRSQSGINT